ncbi:hypothetical protein POKO110462_18180 [Pontibacter korlensis]
MVNKFKVIEDFTFIISKEWELTARQSSYKVVGKH